MTESTKVQDEPAISSTSGGLTVAAAGEFLNLSPHTIRYYERAGLLRVPRDSAGNRRYGREELRRLEFLRRMRASGMSMHTLIRYIDLVGQGEHTVAERLAVMHEHRAAIAAQLHELSAALAATDYKIATYGGRLNGQCDPDALVPKLDDFLPALDELFEENR